MRIRQLYNLIALAVAVLVGQVILPSQALATTYVSQAVVVSTDLLSGSSASSITNFNYNIASLPATSSIRIQFSKDNASWYSATGILGAWTTISTTGGADLSLAAFAAAASWTSGNGFYYKLELNATPDLTQTPALEDIRLDYSPASGYENTFVFDSMGNVGIGTTGPLSKLAINGGLHIGGDSDAGDNNLLVDGSATITGLAGTGNRTVYSDANGVLTNTASDIRLKTNIENLSDKLDVIGNLGKLRGVYYNWNTSIDAAKGLGSQREIGMIAQEVQIVMPELVGQNSGGYLSLDYPKMTAYLVEVAKAQQGQLDGLKLQLNGLGLINGTSTLDMEKSGANPLQWLVNGLQSLGMALKDGVASLKELVVENFTAKKATIDVAKMKEMEMTDKGGNDWCVSLDENGEWVKTKGECGTASEPSNSGGGNSSGDMPSEPVAPAKSNAKSIISFELANSVAVNVDETSRAISLTMPSGTDVTALSPTITVSENATTTPATGEAQDFTNPVTYTVTAQDGSVQEYIVTVTVPASEPVALAVEKIDEPVVGEPTE
jgi:hypothetical protein